MESAKKNLENFSRESICKIQASIFNNKEKLFSFFQKIAELDFVITLAKCSRKFVERYTVFFLKMHAQFRFC